MNLSEPYDRDVLWQVAQVFNIHNHPIELPRGFLGRVFGPIGLLLEGAGLPFVLLNGQIDPASGEFTATGNSGSSTIAGFANVPARAAGRIGAPSSSLKAPTGVNQAAGDSGAVIEHAVHAGRRRLPGRADRMGPARDDQRDLRL